jgi:TP901 family phage tail tape measure protein
VPDYQIDVAVEPDASSFPEQLAAAVSKAEARQAPLEVELEPRVGREFAREAKRRTTAALAKLDAEVELSPALSRGFARDVRKLAKTALANTDVEVTVSPVLPKGFRAEVQREVKKGLTATPVYGDVQLRVDRRTLPEFYRDMSRVAKEAGVLASAACTISPGADLTRFHRELVTGVQATTTAASGTEAASVDVNGDVGRMAAELPAQVAAITAAISASEAASVEISADTGRLVAGTAAGTAAATAAASKGTGGGKTAALLAGGVAVAGTAALLGGAVAGFVAATAATADFEQQLSNLAVVSGATSDQLAKLREQSIQAGRDTAFSAAEAAQAQVELTKAGVSVTDVLGGGLPAALSLASAGELELADAATFVSTGLNVFKLSGEDAARVSDTLSAAANKSAADVSDIGPAFAQSALVAQQLGLSLEDTSGTIALFAQQGLKGSDAGTSFRTMLLRLNPESVKAKETMQELGLQFFDAEGRFVGIEAAAGQLQTQLAGLTDEQRSAALQTIFGTDAIRAANILYEQGAGGVRQWTDAVTDQGYAADVAAGKLDNLRGDLQILKGSLETVFIEAGSSQQEGLRGVVQSLVDVVNTAGPALTQAITPIGELVTALAPSLGTLFNELAPALGSLGEAVTPLLTKLVDVGSVLLVSLTPVFDALAPVGDAFVSILDAVAPLLPVLGRLVALVAGTLAPVFEGLATALEPIVTALVDALTPVIAELSPIMAKLGAVLGDVLGQIGGALGEAVVAILDELAPVIPDLVDALVQLVAATVELLPALTPLLPPLVKLFALITRPVIQLVTLLAEALAALVGAIAPLVVWVGELLASGLDVIVEWFADLDAESVANFFGVLGEALGGAAAAVGRFLAALPGKVVEFFTSLPGRMVDAVLAIGPKLFDAFTSALGYALRAVYEGVTSLIAFWIGLPFRLLDALLSLPQLLVDAFGAAWRFVTEKLPGLVLGLVNWYRELPGKIGGLLVSLGSRLAGVFTSAMSAAGSAVVNGGSAILEWFRELPGRVLDFGRQLLDAGRSLGGKLISGISEGLKNALGFAADVASGVLDALKNAVNGLLQKINDAIPDELGAGPFKVNLPDNPIPLLAEGGVFTSPTLAVIAEAGPEAVVPLNDPARARAVLAAAGLGDATAAAVSTEGGSVARLEAWTDEVVAVLGELWPRVAQASAPPMRAWELSVESMLDRLLASLTRFTSESLRLLTTWGAQVATTTRSAGSAAASSWADGVSRLGPLAATAAAAAVQSLAAQLDAGTTRVGDIVRGYSGELARALNPLLRAVGATTVPEQYARGGYVDGPNVNRDVVPAMLMPGEVVIRKSSVERFGLRQLLALNAGVVPPGWVVPRYADGGEVAAASGASATRGRSADELRRAAGDYSTSFPPTPPSLAAAGALADAARAVMAHAHEAAQDWLVSPALGGGAGGAAAASVWVRSAMALTGVPASWYVGLMTIARRESGYNPRAINLWDSNAAKGVPSKGLMQTIQPTFDAYALPGLRDVWNPVHNAVAAIRYILARYGDIANVQQANPAAPPRGYADGGLVTRAAELSTQLRAQQQATSSTVGRPRGRSVTVEGDVIVQVEPPRAADPESYGMALSHRVVPMLARTLSRL